MERHILHKKKSLYDVNNNTSFTQLILLLLLFLCLPHTVLAQTYTMGIEQYMTWDEFVNDYFDEFCQPENKLDKSNWQIEALEQLEDLHNHPININTAQRNELLRLPILTEAQADSILQYREKKHLLRSLGELQWISGIPYSTRCQLSLFVFAGDTLSAIAPKGNRFYEGKHNIVTRMDIPLYKRAGDHHFSQTDLQEHPSKFYLGNRIANTVRYRYKWKKDLAYGLTLQKDSGEPFAAHKNYPYDYNSFYFYFRPDSRRFSIWVGDYNINIGEGLLLGSSFMNGALQLVENKALHQAAIRPHTSSDEINYFRGLASSFKINSHWQISAFSSFRKIDGSLKNDTVISLKTDGQHRSLTEINNRQTLNNLVVGGRVTYQEENWHVEANTYWCHYDKTIYPPFRRYNQYYLRGKSAAGMSANYAWHSRHWHIQGETAIDKDFNATTSNLLRFTPNSRYTFFIQHRSLSKRYVAPFANTLQEGSHTQNEHGFILGTSFSPFSKIHMTSYANYFYHPSPTYLAYQPSHGFEYFFLTQYAPSQNLNFIVRYKVKTKEQNITGHPDMLQYTSTHRGRFTTAFTSPNYSFNVSLDASAVTKQTSPTTFGWMLSTRHHLRPTSNFSMHAFASIFFTDDYASRLYAYEPQLQYAASFPTFAYHGTRIAGVVQWNFLKKAYVALRYGWTNYFNRKQISSGPQQINSSSKSDLSIQLAWSF